ncbi:hypothetical protein E2C01_005805 [Portunus trituberculatus]|uniref:Uncharacterized protein n=1 Tax=Portunus trituberculatus TaxID=210409 RepID=A0A5B7CVC6_PORTR|nr:hypothetical protein [Portunus trituberculatus]
MSGLESELLKKSRETGRPRVSAGPTRVTLTRPPRSDSCVSHRPAEVAALHITLVDQLNLTCSKFSKMEECRFQTCFPFWIRSQHNTVIYNVHEDSFDDWRVKWTKVICHSTTRNVKGTTFLALDALGSPCGTLR